MIELEPIPHNPKTITGRFFLFLEINKINIDELAKKRGVTVDQIKAFKDTNTDEEMALIIELTDTYHMSINWLVSGDLPMYKKLPGMEKYPDGYKLGEINLQLVFIDKMNSMYNELLQRWAFLDRQLKRDAATIFDNIETRLDAVHNDLLKVESMAEKAFAVKCESVKREMEEDCEQMGSMPGKVLSRLPRKGKQDGKARKVPVAIPIEKTPGAQISMYVD